MTPAYYWRTILIGAVIATILVGLVAINDYARRVVAPPLLRYVTSDASGVVYAPSLEGLVQVLDSHTSPLFPEGLNCDSYDYLHVAGALKDLACGFTHAFGVDFFTDEKSASLSGLYDACPAEPAGGQFLTALRRRGVDVAEPIVFISRGPVIAGDFLAIFSAADVNCFLIGVNEWLPSASIKRVMFDESDVLSPVTVLKGVGPTAPASPDDAFAYLGRASGSTLVAQDTITPASVQIFNPARSERGALLTAARYFAADDLCGTQSLRRGAPLRDLSGGDRIFLQVSHVDSDAEPPYYRLLAEEGALLLHSDGITAVRPARLQEVSDPSLLQMDAVIDGKDVRIGIAGPAICYAIIDGEKVALFTNMETLKAALSKNPAAVPIVYEKAFRQGVATVVNDSSEASQLWGYLKQPGLYAAAPVAFSLAGSKKRLNLRVWTSLRVGESNLLSRIFRQSDGNLTGIDGTAPTRLQFVMRDRDVGELIRMMQQTFPNLYRYLQTALEGEETDGSRYYGLLDVLSETPNIKEFGFDVSDVGEILPVGALSLAVPQAAASELVFRLQRQQRFARDTSIYEGAIQEEQGSAGRPIKREADDRSDEPATPEAGAHITPDQLMSDLNRLRDAGLLIDEDPDLFTKLATGKYEEADFTGARYCGCLRLSESYAEGWTAEAGFCNATTCRSNISYAYLFPPVSENDFKYRSQNLETNAEKALSVFGLDDGAEGKTSIDIIRDDLLADRHRAVAVYDREFERLLLAPDLEGAELAFSRPKEARPVANARQLFPRDIEKISLRVDPYWVSQELRGSSDPDVQELGEELFAEIADYSEFRAMIGVSGRNGGTIVELDLERQ